MAQKLANLRAEADHALERAEQAEAKNKHFEQELLTKEQEIRSLTTRLNLLEDSNEKAEVQIRDMKSEASHNAQASQTVDGLNKKVQMLEEELDAAEKNVKETVEKYAGSSPVGNFPNARDVLRLRQVDVKAEHFERQIARVEQERDAWEKKYEVC